jgi:hypothetical protein
MPDTQEKSHYSPLLQFEGNFLIYLSPLSRQESVETVLSLFGSSDATASKLSSLCSGVPTLPRRNCPHVVREFRRYRVESVLTLFGSSDATASKLSSLCSGVPTLPRRNCPHFVREFRRYRVETVLSLFGSSDATASKLL